MAPPATATARRAGARPAPSAPRRAPLRLFEPAPRRKHGARIIRRPTMVASGVLIVGSLLAVVVGDAMVTVGQVRLSATQRQVAAAVAVQKALQVDVAQKAAPPVVVTAAKGQGLVVPNQVVYLPQVPLNVPLPVPKTIPASSSTTGQAGAGSTAGGNTATVPAHR